MARRSRAKSKTSRPNRHAGRSTHLEVGDETDLSELVTNNECPFLLVLDGVQDPHNLGACLRSADAAGVHAVVVPRNRAVSLTDTVINIACGAAENVPLIEVTNIARTLRDLQKEGVWVLGTADDTEATLYDIDMKGPLAIVMGAEGTGLRRLTKETCDFLARIPMRGTVDCLNISVATGICLFEAIRQRGGAKTKD